MRAIILTMTALALASTHAFAQTPSAEARLKAMNITLPEAAKPIANYVEWVREGHLLFLAGHTPDAQWNGKGKVGKDVTVEQGRQAAREVGLRLLATMREALGSLDKVKRVVRTFGMVNAGPGFGEEPAVINGCSDLMTEVFGDVAGKGIRAAVGVAELPNAVPVEIEMIVEVKD